MNPPRGARPGLVLAGRRRPVQGDRSVVLPPLDSEQREAASRAATPEKAQEPEEELCTIDRSGLVAVPQGLFDRMLALGKEARAGGQHILVTGKNSRGNRSERLVQKDLCLQFASKKPC